MKKLFKLAISVIIVLLCVTTLSLFGCKTEASPDTTEETTEEVTEEAAEEVTEEAAEGSGQINLIWWSYEFQYESYFNWVKDELIPAFETANPNITIDAVNIPYDNYQAKYLSAFTTRVNAPDIFTGNCSYYAAGLGVADPAKGEIKEYFEENLVPAILPSTSYDGEIYGASYQCDLGMMYVYNKHKYEEAGLDPNDPPETIDEFLDHMQKLTKPDGSQYGFGVRYSGNAQGVADKFLPFLHAFGARLYSPDGKVATGYINSDEAVAALQFYGDLVHKYKVASLEVGTPRDAFGQGFTASLFREAFMIEFMKSNFEMIAGEDFAFAPLPNGAADPGWTTLFGAIDMVYKYAPEENKEAAWKFLKFLFEPENDWIKTSEKIGSLPNNKLLWEEKKDILKARADYEAEMEIVEDEPMFYDSPVIIDLAVSLGEAIQNVFFNQADPKEELDNAAKKMDKSLSNFWASVE